MRNPRKGGKARRENADLRTLRRDLLRDAIADIQGSIRANDTKSSAALIVHGLLFAGTLALTREVVPVFETAEAWQRWTIAIVLAIALASFLCSVGALLLAVSPYHPTKLRHRIASGHQQAFFPLLYDLRKKSTAEGTNELVVYKALIKRLDAADVEADYAAELLKLAAVRRHEADWARRGYRTLMLELVAVATYLTFTAAVALSQMPN